VLGSIELIGWGGKSRRSDAGDPRRGEGGAGLFGSFPVTYQTRSLMFDLEWIFLLFTAGRTKSKARMGSRMSG